MALGGLGPAFTEGRETSTIRIRGDLMATYAIGDIHGCFRTFRNLLKRIGFKESRDRLWLTGDLVRRGPNSLKTLRWCLKRSDIVESVVGNHDLHLLALAAGIGKTGPRDTLDAVLSAPDRDELIDWLRARPVMVREGDWTMVHAGLLPGWTLAEADKRASELEALLRADDWGRRLARLRAADKADWTDSLRGAVRLRALSDVFTRLRLVDSDGCADYEFSGPPGEAPAGLTPWFEAKGRRRRSEKIVFGHWAAQGLRIKPGVYALDSGCAWGGPLTALRLEDEKLFQEPYAEDLAGEAP